MNDDSIGMAIARAERAADGVADPTFREKAFEVILNRLLSGASRPPAYEDSTIVAPIDTHDVRPRDRSPRGEPKTLSQRVLALQGEGFFREPQAIAKIRGGLGARGWHYPVTTLSGVLQSLTQKRKLRRERVRDGRKMTWKYSNP